MPIPDDELEEMQDPNSWSFPIDAITPGLGQHALAIVSVTFNRDEFERLHACAAERGMRLSAFIREAALGQADDTANKRSLARGEGKVRPAETD